MLQTAPGASMPPSTGKTARPRVVRGRGSRIGSQCAGTEGERRAWAETLWRFVFKGNLVGAMFNADPHPGNYLFGPDGRVTFLDARMA